VTLTQATMDDLADWLAAMREDGWNAGDLLESVEHKLRTLGAGPAPTYSDPLPIDESRTIHRRWPYLQLALDSAQMRTR
jgi:hypothetical protein